LDPEVLKVKTPDEAIPINEITFYDGVVFRESVIAGDCGEVVEGSRRRSFAIWVLG
jgi:hypothetical protein